MKRRHHYVPQFYLRGFASAPRRINVFNLRRGLPIKNASLRDQCFQHRLYGKQDVLEDAFSELESLTAPVVATIVTTQEPPDSGSKEYIGLVAIVALQQLRTTAALARLKQASEKLAGAAFDGAPPAGFVLDDQQAMILSLSTHRLVTNILDDLKAHTIIASVGTQFVTSDNPACHYNLYCEGLVGVGVAGAACRGLQVFLPVSPQVAVLLFDGAVYKVGRKGTAVSSIATPEDVAAINLVQFAAAQDNVYFADWGLGQQLGKLAARARSLRPVSRMHVQKAYEVGNEKSVLLHQYEQTPNLRLRLSFVSLRRAARRVPLFERGRQVRRPVPGVHEGPRSTAGSEGAPTRVFRAQRPN